MKPNFTLEANIRQAIRAAKDVLDPAKNQDWLHWAARWLSGENRGIYTAVMAAAACDNPYGTSAVDYASRAAANAAHAAANAAAATTAVSDADVAMYTALAMAAANTAIVDASYAFQSRFPEDFVPSTTE